MGFLTPGTPPDRNYGVETANNLISQVKIAPYQLLSEQTISPLYADLGASNINRFLLGNGTAPGVQSTLDTAANQQRASDIGAVEKFGGRATAAFRNANPAQAKLMNLLNTQATDELGMGSKLAPGMAREVQQASRAASSARGLVTSPSSALDEIIMSGERGNQLQQQRRSFASGVVGLDHSTTVDPFMAILGRPASSAGMAGSVPTGPGFNPESPYAGDVYNTNYNANAAKRIAGANNAASVLGSY